MKKLLLSLMIIFCCAALSAQQPGGPQRQHQHKHGAGQMPNFEKFLEDRIAFVTKMMNLSPEDSEKFVPIYKDKLKAKGELMFKSRPRTHIIPGQVYADSVYINAAMIEAQYKIDDAKIDMEYLKKFRKILTPQQLYGYVQAEKMFVGSFMHGGGPNANNWPKK